MADEDVQTQTDADYKPAEEDAAAVAVTDSADSDDSEQSEIDKLKEELQVTTEEVGTLRKKLIITVPRAAIDRRMSEQYDELSHDATVPGFRKGRAPRRLIEKRFGHDVSDQIRTQLVGQAYLAATEKEDLKTLGDPMIWATPKSDKQGEAASGEKLVSVQEALALIELPDEGDLTLACEVEVRPEFSLPDLKGIKLERPKVSITDDDVDKEINRRLATLGSWEPVEEGPVEADDMIVADVKMTVDDETVIDEENVELAARPQRIEGIVLEDLGEVLVGKKIGDECTAEATVPDDHERENLRGKTAKFTFKLQDLKRLRLPELDSDFLAGLGFETEKDLRAFFRTEMEAKLDQVINEALHNQAQRYLLENVELDLPDQLSSRQIDRAVVRRMVDMRMQGVPQEEIEKHADELRTTVSEQVPQELKLQFILDAVGEEQEVEVSEEELNAQIAGIARQYNRRFDRVRDELAKGDGMHSLYVRLRDAKILDRLVADAEISDVEPPDDDDEAPKKPKKKSAKKKSKKKKASTVSKDAKPADDYADET